MLKRFENSALVKALTTEALDTLDLKEAKAPLDELHA